LYGGTETKVVEIEVGFLLNKNGDLILGIKAPALFREAIKNLLDFGVDMLIFNLCTEINQIIEFMFYVLPRYSDTKLVFLR